MFQNLPIQRLGLLWVLSAENVGLPLRGFQDDGAARAIIGHAGVAAEFLVFEESCQQPEGAKPPGAGAGHIFAAQLRVGDVVIGNGGGAVVGYIRSEERR